MARKKKQLTLPHVPAAEAKRPKNPLVAFRCPKKVIAAFVKKHGSRDLAWRALVKHMERAA